MEYRQACCDYMLNDDPEFFSAFLDDQKLGEYISEMRTDGTWGSQSEIVGLCKAYNVHCVLFRPDGVHYRIECDSADDDDTRILMLSHHQEEHFNEVRFKDKSRCLTSFNELELLLTELKDSPVRLSKKEARFSRKSGKGAPKVSEAKNSQKLIEL